MLQTQFHPCAHEQNWYNMEMFLLVLFILAEILAPVPAMTACSNFPTNSHWQQKLNIFCEETKGWLRPCGLSLFSMTNIQVCFENKSQVIIYNQISGR